MPSWLNSDWLFGSLAWEFISRLVALSYLTDVVWWPLGHLFGIFRTKLQTTLFLLLFPLAISFLLIAFSSSAQLSPSIYGEIFRVAYGGHSEDGKIKNAFDISMIIYNKGTMPSIVKDLKVFAVMSDSQSFEATLILTSVPINFGGNEQTVTVQPPTFLLDKMIFPIPVGGSFGGNIVGSFPQIKDGSLFDVNRFDVLFSDVTGHSNVVSVKSNKNKISNPFYLPGIDMRNTR